VCETPRGPLARAVLEQRAMRITIIPALLLVGCTSSDTTPQPSGVLEPPPTGEGIQLSLVHSLNPGDEIHWCRYFVLDEAIDVQRFEHAYTSGSHHVLAYTTPFTAATVPTTTDFSCENGANEQFNGVAYAGAVSAGELAFPADVGFHFDAGAVILVEGHYLNAGDAPIDAEVAVNLWKAPAPPTQQAGTLFFYDNNIFVPANSTYTARMTCELSKDINVVSMLSHMHSRGVRYQAQATQPGGSPQQLLATDQWLNPDPMILPTPMKLAAGTRIDYACDYRDTTGTAVMEGQSKTQNEMCMLIGAYWPRMDFAHEFCAAPGSGSVFDGTTTCAQSLGCQQNAKDGLAAERCATNTCRASSQAFDDVQGCVFGACIATGQCTGPDCGACAAQRCGAQIGACMQATCN
jgi:copper type II ascorbate-dependent monooxygenase-like protein